MCVCSIHICIIASDSDMSLFFFIGRPIAMNEERCQVQQRAEEQVVVLNEELEQLRARAGDLELQLKEACVVILDRCYYRYIICCSHSVHMIKVCMR